MDKSTSWIDRMHANPDMATELAEDKALGLTDAAPRTRSERLESAAAPITPAPQHAVTRPRTGNADIDAVDDALEAERTARAATVAALTAAKTEHARIEDGGPAADAVAAYARVLELKARISQHDETIAALEQQGHTVALAVVAADEAALADTEKAADAACAQAAALLDEEDTARRRLVARKNDVGLPVNTNAELRRTQRKALRHFERFGLMGTQGPR
jgi:hypothetical protein